MMHEAHLSSEKGTLLLQSGMWHGLAVIEIRHNAVAADSAPFLSS